MECKLTITGTFSDIQRALCLLQGGTDIEAILETLNPEPVSSSRHQESDPLPRPIDLKRDETKTNGATLNPDLPCEPMARIEKVNTRGRRKKSVLHEVKTEPAVEQELAYRHCNTCGKPFTPPRPTSHHCSKRCYMIEWREKNSVKKSDRVKDAEDLLDSKLAEIRKTCPSPKPRPEFNRDLIS